MWVVTNSASGLGQSVLLQKGASFRLIHGVNSQKSVLCHLKTTPSRQTIGRQLKTIINIKDLRAHSRQSRSQASNVTHTANEDHSWDSGREAWRMVAACIAALVLQRLLAACAKASPQLACLCAAAFFTRPLQLQQWRLFSSSAATGSFINAICLSRNQPHD